MKAYKSIALALLSCLALSTVAMADDFSFSYVVGDKYRVLSTVDEDVYINRQYSHSARILNRIAFEVAKVRDDGAALLKGDFSTSVRYAGGYSYVADKLYHSEYWHLKDGRYEIGSQYYMPTVRHVPRFPARSLSPGDSWNAPGEERHDFREDFGIPDPYVIPIDVRYSYEGPGTLKGVPVRLVRAAYTVFEQAARPRQWTVAYPTQIAGYSDQLLYWDPARGALVGYEERFKFVFELSDGRTVEYRGEASSEVVEASIMNRATLEKELRDAVSDLKDVSVQSDERGVTIRLENIQFAADSSRLLPQELAKIQRIASIISKVEGRDVRVSGHTALAGTESARKLLSVERARAVAEELIRLGARKPESLTVIGYGAEKPIADNTSESGMARNRRVEITILEN
ncbi:MAG: OmpA family protein [Spirochaetia bacterium]|jgi:outer membrane protein OmpA-like peptidoglycan-associated protein|nr:OmpA family protein [Spirochaetia bacterium]